MTSKEAIDYIRCAIGCGCSQVCNSKNRGDCADAEVIEAKDMAIEALANQEILLDLLETMGSEYICMDVDPEWCSENCKSFGEGAKRECYLEYCKIKREEKNDSH